MALNGGRFFRWQSIFNLKTAIALACIVLIGWFAAAFALDNKQMFLPGETSVSVTTYSRPPAIPAQFQVRGVPYLALLKADRTVARTFIGEVPKQVLANQMAELL